MKYILFAAIAGLLATSCSRSEPDDTHVEHTRRVFQPGMDFTLVKDSYFYTGNWMAIGEYSNQHYPNDTYKLKVSPIALSPEFIVDENSKITLIWDKEHGEGFKSVWGYNDEPSFLQGSLVAQPKGVQLELLQ